MGCSQSSKALTQGCNQRTHEVDVPGHSFQVLANNSNSSNNNNSNSSSNNNNSNSNNNHHAASSSSSSGFAARPPQFALATGAKIGVAAVGGASGSTSSLQSPGLGAIGGPPKRSVDSDDDDDDDDEVEEDCLSVPIEHATPAHAPSHRIRLFRPEVAPKFSANVGIRRSRSLMSRTESESASQVLREQLESGTQALSEMAFGAALQGLFGRKKPAEAPSTGGDSGKEFDQPFGQDVLGGAVGSPACGSVCSICMCEPDDVTLWRVCRTETCTSRFCSDCMSRYASTKVEEALHFVPALKCPGCWCRISTPAWGRFVPESVRKRYIANASALLTVRCARCDGTHSLLIPDPEENTLQKKEDTIVAKHSIKAPDLQRLRAAWDGFDSGTWQADQLLLKLLEIARDLKIGDDVDETELVEGQLAPPLQLFMHDLLGLAADLERRVTLHLALLRRYPKIRTHCCSQKMCYKCKVKGWHPKVSCEERQRRFLTIDAAGIQACPVCGVPTQKTEGCNEVRCVCGHTWSWSEKAGAVPGGVPAISVALGLPSKGPELMSTLLKARADVSATSQDGWGIFHHAAARRQRRQFHAGYMDLPDLPEHNDTTRLAYLLGLGPEVAALKDSMDTEGDSGLSVAIAHDNLEGAKLLLEQGARLNAGVLSSLRDHSAPRSAAELCHLLRKQAETYEHVPGSLWFFVESGLVNKAKDAISKGDAVEIDAVAALVLLRIANDAEFKMEVSDSTIRSMEELLKTTSSKAGSNWETLCQSGATALLRRQVRLTFLERFSFDVPLIRALLKQKADPQATVDIAGTDARGRGTVPILSLTAGSDPRYQDGRDQLVLNMLLQASASPNMPDRSGDPPLWWAISRSNPGTVKTLVEGGAAWPSDCRRLASVLQSLNNRRILRQVVLALQPLLEKWEDTSPTTPLWLRLLSRKAPGSIKEALDAISTCHRSGTRVFDDLTVAMAILLDDDFPPNECGGSSSSSSCANSTGNKSNSNNNNNDNGSCSNNKNGNSRSNNSSFFWWATGDASGGNSNGKNGDQTNTSGGTGILVGNSAASSSTAPPTRTTGLLSFAHMEQEVRRVAGDTTWSRFEKGGATALLLKELRGAHLDDRDLDLDLIKRLIRMKADVNARQQSIRGNGFSREWGEEDLTPLVLLANASEVSPSASTEAVKLLVEACADVEAADDDGDTALSWAVMKLNTPVVQALTEVGASLGLSLVEEDGSPLAALSHPAIMRPIAQSLGPKIRQTLEDFPTPPLWLVVQFGTAEALKKLVTSETDAPEVTPADAEALLRRRLQHGGELGSASGSLEDIQIASELRRAAVAQLGDENAQEDTAARAWKSLLADAATGLLRQEIEGSFEGQFDLDLSFVETLLELGAEPNLQVVSGEELDEDDLDDSDLFEDEEEEDEYDEDEDEDDDEEDDDADDDDDDEEEEDDDDDEEDGNLELVSSVDLNDNNQAAPAQTGLNLDMQASPSGNEVKLRL